MPAILTISRTRRLIDLETHEAVFTWILQRLADAGLVKGKTVGIDATVVVDEHRAHHGHAEIAGWKADASAKYHYTSDAISLETSGRDIVVSARVTGAFPGSPAMLRYRFTLETDAIVRLETTT